MVAFVSVVFAALIGSAAAGQTTGAICQEQMLLQKRADLTASEDLGLEASASASTGYLWSGDAIHLRAHTGRRLATDGEEVHAKWWNQGSWETFVVELKDEDGRIARFGDAVRLRAHTGQYMMAEGKSINAKAAEHPAEWEEFVLEPSPADECGRKTWPGTCYREVQIGDGIFLRAHTGNRVAVQSDHVVHAKWPNQGGWETLVVEKTSSDQPSGAKYFNCECCDCRKAQDVQGRCAEKHGQFEVVTDLASCQEAFKTGSLQLGDHCPSGSPWLGVISSAWYPAGCFLTPARTKDCEWFNIGFNILPADVSESRSKCCGQDRSVCKNPPQ